MLRKDIDNSLEMAKEQSRLEVELERCRKMCEDLRLENIRKEETIETLSAALKDTRINSATSYVYDAVIEDGVVKRHSWKIDHEALMKRRKEAFQTHRILCCNHVGASTQIDDSNEEGCGKLG